MVRFQKTTRTGTLDKVLFVAMLMLSFLGLLCIMSAVKSLNFSDTIVRTHLIALPLGMVAFLSAWSFNYQIFDEQWKPLYGIILALLVGVLIFGTYQRGSKSWFVLPFFSFQPAELCRVLSILVAAAFLDRRGRYIRDIRTVLLLGVLLAPILGLIMMQPDFSSIVITCPALLLLLYCAGVRVFYLSLVLVFGVTAGLFTMGWTYLYLHPALRDHAVLDIFANLSSNGWYMLGFVGLLGLGAYGTWWLCKQLRITLPVFYFILVALVILSGFFAGMFVDHKMKPYQRKRVEAFLAPQSDPQGASYNVLQAQIAMGSGGILGKGLFSGTQSRLGFVPEKHTDFILAVMGEELGLWGTLLALGLYLLILWRIVAIGYMSSDRYGYLVCGGIFGMFLTYMLINFGMLIGLLPVAGIPLPFISYGGSNLVSSMLALGVVQSVYARRITSA